MLNFLRKKRRWLEQIVEIFRKFFTKSIYARIQVELLMLFVELPLQCGIVVEVFAIEQYRLCNGTVLADLFFVYNPIDFIWFQNFLQRGKGYKKSIMAMGRKLMTYVYYVLKNDLPYIDPKIDYQKKHVERNFQRFVAQLRQCMQKYDIKIVNKETGEVI